MSDSGTYLFAVAASDWFGPTIDVNVLPEPFRSVRTIIADDLMALVSTYTGPAIEDIPQSGLTGHLLLHQKVIEDLMRGGSVLPVRLGTVLKDDDAIATLLHGSKDLLRTTWERFRGTVEVDIAATWDLVEILAQVGDDPEILAAKSAAMTTEAELRFEAVVGVGKLVEAKLDKCRGELELKMLEHLRPYANDVQLNSVVSDELACNIALLVDQSQVAHIDEALHRLDARLEGRFDFRRVGPLPPYSFATVHVRRIGRETIESCLTLLGLSGCFDESAVLDQYRSLALTRHPDVRREDPNAALDFEVLTAARATLLSVCRNHPDTSRVPDSGVLFASVERSIGRN